MENSKDGLENIPADESTRIERVAQLTKQQLGVRYPNPQQILRGVHAKDHGCVDATFRVRDDLEEPFRVGLFAQTGAEFRSRVRFSNAATLLGPDSTVDPESGEVLHGSRGMAIKVFDVPDGDGRIEQDFLMVNQPVFAFANIEDYEVLSEVLLNSFDPATNTEDASGFFAQQIAKGGEPAARAQITLQIAGRIRSADPAIAFQTPPTHPAQATYFSAAPFGFGPDRVMKFRVRPVHEPITEEPDVNDPDYLRHGLTRRLDPNADDNRPILYEFDVQVRDASSLDTDRDIENASTERSDEDFPFVQVATLIIEPQDTTLEQNRTDCETSFFTPWHTLECFRPLGGINRLRRLVYEASMETRSKSGDNNDA